MSTTADINPIDRLGLTLFVALVFHAVVILGIAFTRDTPKKLQSPDRTLEILVVHHPTETKKPDKADFLAQTSQEGGGTTKQKDKPTVAPSPIAAQPNPTEKPAKLPVEKPSETQVQPRTKRVITSHRAKPKRVEPTPEKKTKPREKKKLTATQLIASTNQEISRLTAELDRKTKAYSKRLRHKRLTASTQEYKYANYLDAWRRKVENIGNLNYPDEAKRRRLHGNLVLHVAVLADGSVKEINIKKSSGKKVLDDAAVRIVRLSAPFAPFSPEIREETDIIDIIRTWQFRSNNTFQ